MGVRSFVVCFVVIVPVVLGQARTRISHTYEQFVIEGQAQGTTYSIKYYADKERLCKVRVDSVLKAIDVSMSTYMDTSLISRFNRPFCPCISMDHHMRVVIAKSFEFYKRSRGAFDISVKPLLDLWGFGRRPAGQFPDSASVSGTLQYVGMEKLYRPSDTILCKSDLRVQIDLNGIAQGYTVDELAALLDSVGVSDYLVELGGEVRTKGKKPNGSPFAIALFAPEVFGDHKDRVVHLRNRAITTSGNYENVRKFSGKTVSHHIDPRSGYPVDNQIISVTVIAPTAMESDAWDNVFITLSPKKALTLANKLKKIDIYILYSEDGKVQEGFSKGFGRYLKVS